MLVRDLIPAIALIALLSACGPKHASRPMIGPGNQAETTGFEKESEYGPTPYTISGNPEVYRELRSEFQGKSPAMARSIKKVTVKKLATDQYQVRVQFNGLYFGLEELVFKGRLKTKGTEKHVLISDPNKTPASYAPRFTLDVRCRSLDCQMMVMRLHEKTGKYFRAEAVMIYQERETRTRIVESDKGGIEDLDVNLDETVSTQTSVVIVEGPSYSEVTLSKKDAKPEDKPILQVRTDLVDTSTHAENVQSITVKGGTIGYKASLEGNQSETGDLMLNVEKEDGSGSVRVIVETPQADNRGPQRIHLGIGDRSLDPSGISADIDEFTKGLNAYSNNPEVLRRIDYITGKSKSCAGCKFTFNKSRAINFLMNLQAVTSEILEASQITNVSPELAYITYVESNFLTRDNFPIQVAESQRNAAAGPWQIKTDTAKHSISSGKLPFKVFDVKSGKLAPEDDRNYFYESAVIALNYFNVFPEEIRHDPGLQIASYHKGPYKYPEIVERHGGSNVSFPDLIKFNAITDAATVADYVYSIISIAFVGRNPKANNLEVPDLTEVPTMLRPKLRNPNR